MKNNEILSIKNLRKIYHTETSETVAVDFVPWLLFSHPARTVAPIMILSITVVVIFPLLMLSVPFCFFILFLFAFSIRYNNVMNKMWDFCVDFVNEEWDSWELRVPDI